MSAPTPQEQATITRFSMFDNEVLEHMERFADRPLECALPKCVQPAGWRVAMRCCGHSVVLCDPHGSRSIAKMRAKLHRDRRVSLPECAVCDHVFPRGSTLDDIARVVQL